MRKRFLTLCGTLLISSSIYGQNINIINGWQLKGTETGFTNMINFNNNCIETVWTYNNNENKWKVYSSDENIKQLINNNSSIDELTSINKNDGFWINAKSDCVIHTDSNTDINTSVYNNISTDGLLKSILDPNGIENTAFKGVVSINNYAYVVSRDGVLLVYDISTLDEIELPIKSIQIANPDDWNPTNHILQNKNYLYVTGSKLYIIDISTPDNPVLLNSFDYHGKWNTPTIYNFKMLITDSYSSSKVKLLDISTPEAPQLLKTYDDIGKSIIADNFIYSVNSSEKVTKYSLSDTYTLNEIASASAIIDSQPYNLYYYNNQLIVITSNNIYIYNTLNNMELLKTIEVYSTRTSGCKDNICVVGTKIYDLNHIDNTPLVLNQSTYNADGFPFQAYINDDGYIFRCGQEDIKINKIDFNITNNQE